MEKKLKVLMQSIAQGKETFGLPGPEEPRVWTNFTR